MEKLDWKDLPQQDAETSAFWMASTMLLVGLILGWIFAKL